MPSKFHHDEHRSAKYEIDIVVQIVLSRVDRSTTVTWFGGQTTIRAGPIVTSDKSWDSATLGCGNSIQASGLVVPKIRSVVAAVPSASR